MMNSEHLRIEEMRGDLEHIHNISLPAKTPPTIIRALWDCANTASDRSVPFAVREMAEYWFELLLEGNENWADRVREYEARENTGSMAWWDSMGLPPDEIENG